LQSAFEFILSRRRNGDGRRGAIALAIALLVFVAALAFSTDSAYGASHAKPPKKVAKKKPKVKAFVFRRQLNVVGTAGNDRITLRLKPGNPSRLQVDVGTYRYAEYTFKRSRFNRILVHARSGADAMAIDESYGVFTNSEATSLYGDGGSDLVAAKGSNAAERFDFSRDRSRLRYVRNNNRVYLAQVERFDLRALGGADEIVVNDVSGSGLARLNADSGAAGDRVSVKGKAANDNISVAASAVAGHISVTGSPAAVDLVNTEALSVESLGGNDSLSGGLGLAALTQLSMDGGAGNDSIAGGDGNDALRGGTENDSIDGNRGDDLGLLGAGDDSFTWDPGDGSDKVEGEAGTDTMVFNGAGVAENFDFSANGNRLKFFRNVANITMDVDDTERVDLRALGGIDNTVVNDLSATDVKNIDLDLASDTAVDTTTVNGSAGNDSIAIAPNAGAVDVTGLAAALKIKGSEAANDVLNVNGLDGNDTISGAIGVAALIKVGIDGGPGNDVINGGDGAEVLVGGDGNDAIDGNRGDDTGLLGLGDDSFRWDPGDGSDVVEGAAGIDTLLFNGAGVAENFTVSANGERARFLRDVANITMDLNDTERIDTQALGGIDNAVVNDLTGTDVNFVAFDLETAIGGGAGDGAADSITVNGTAGNDVINVTASGSAVNVGGLPAVVNIDHSEAANDRLTVNGLAGTDTITAGPGLAALIQLVLNGGTEIDVLTGGDGNDRIVGQQQNDSMFGGTGNDTLVWNPGDGNDLIEGQAGNDTMEFNGAGVAEIFDASAVAGRLRFTRNVANIVMDVGTTETIDLNALGAADTVTVSDLTGTAVTRANIDLAAAIGGVGGDGAADAITINGTNAADNVAVAANAGVIDVTGLVTAVTIRNSEAANDTLAINTLGGNDDVAVGGGVAGLIQTLVDLGADD
jgi:Ca2+-binding RTX toxin-like protein